MSTQSPKGFTDYLGYQDGLKHGKTEPIIVISYDNDKYCVVKRLSDGMDYEVKRGYITRDEEGTKFFNRRFWKRMGGQDPRNFRPRVKKTRYEVRDTSVKGNYLPATGSKKEAIRRAKLVSKRTGGEVRIYVAVDFENNHCYTGSLGCLDLFVQGREAYQYGRADKNRMQQLKYLRGHGKIYNNHRPGKKH